MKRLRILTMAVVLLSLTACASSPEADLDNLPEPKTPEEAVQNILALSVGYCKGMSEKHGADFSACFKEQTDYVLSILEKEGAPS